MSGEAKDVLISSPTVIVQDQDGLSSTSGQMQVQMTDPPTVYDQFRIFCPVNEEKCRLMWSVLL